MADTTNTHQALDGNGQVHQDPSSRLVEGPEELLIECHRHGVYLTLCGEVLPVSGLESSECEREITYCTDCLHAAVEQNADAGLVWSPPGTCLLVGSSWAAR